MDMNIMYAFQHSSCGEGLALYWIPVSPRRLEVKGEEKHK